MDTGSKREGKGGEREAHLFLRPEGPGVAKTAGAWTTLGADEEDADDEADMVEGVV